MLKSQATETDRIRHNLTNHPPAHVLIGEALDEMTAAAIAFSDVVDRLVPAGREKSLALTDIERASQSAKAGIARMQEQLIASIDA